MKRSGPIKRKRGLTRRSQGQIAYAEELDAITPALVARSRGICEICHYAPAAVRHHRLRRSQGGGNELANLLHLCCSCHDRLHANPVLAYDRGWMLRRSR